MKVAVAGANGRMGRTLIEAIGTDRELSLTVLLDVTGVGSEIGGLKVTSDLASAAHADVLIDFTRPEGTLQHLKHAKAMVIGTTGFDEKGKGQIAAASKRMPIVLSPNFAVARFRWHVDSRSASCSRYCSERKSRSSCPRKPSSAPASAPVCGSACRNR